MAEHHELVSEMPILEQMGTQERQKLAKKRRLQQLKKWSQREKEWIAKERQLNKRLANLLHEENNGLDLKQYTTYGSNQKPKKRLVAVNGSTKIDALNGPTTNSSNNNNNNNNNISESNNKNLNGNATKGGLANSINNDILINHQQVTSRNGYRESNLTPNGRVHFNVGVMLLEAAARNDIDEVKRLLMLGVSPDSVNHDGLTALHQCCIDASEPIMSLLIEFGANVDARDTERWTPLHAACTCGHLNLVKILVENGADLLAVNGDGNMPFDICEDESTLEFIESQMVNRGITQEMIDLTRVSTEVQMINDLEKLLADGKDLNGADKDGVTPLHIAAANGYQSVVKFLLKHNVIVNVCDKDLWTPLHGAVCWGNEQHISIVESLVEAGANLTAKTSNDETPFDLCDNVILLDRLNQLKDELESKQATETDKLKRTQSRTNSRVHSVRRTSVRDKNQISRREAREEALLRVDNSPEKKDSRVKRVEDSDDVSRESPRDQTDAFEPQNPNINGSDSKFKESSNESHKTSLPKNNSNVRLKESATETLSKDAQSKLEIKDLNRFNGTKSKVRPDDESRPSLDLSQRNQTSNQDTLGGLAIHRSVSEGKQSKVQSFDAITLDPTSNSNQMNVTQSAVQLIPVNYTLSNLKKHRSDLRMRTSSIGNSSVVALTSSSHLTGGGQNQLQNNGQILLDPQATSEVTLGDGLTNHMLESPNSNIFKFHGEPSESIRRGKLRNRQKCCTIC